MRQGQREATRVPTRVAAVRGSHAHAEGAKGEGRSGRQCMGIHHTHEEHRVRWCRGVPRRADAERIRIALEALCLSAHGVPLKRIQHFLDARPLWSVLANAVHQVLPHRHDLRAAASRLR